MHYTQAQKDKLYQALLPRCYVDGVSLLVDAAGNITDDLTKYQATHLVVHPEELAPHKRAQLEKKLDDFFAKDEVREERFRNEVESLFTSNKGAATLMVQQAIDRLRERHQAADDPRRPKHGLLRGGLSNTPKDIDHSLRDIENLLFGAPITPAKLAILSTTPVAKAIRHSIRKDHVHSLVMDLQWKIRTRHQNSEGSYRQGPFETPPAAVETASHAARFLADHCPEEAELLCYKHKKNANHWPVLLLNKPVPCSGLKGGAASGEMCPLKKALLIEDDKTSHGTYPALMEKEVTLYEEI
ncbi:MAG: hypothetical protein K2Q01_11695, partial [Rickettsiales bacterium]|nr:hypothetical protein [Rickettsiales bacterium]